MRKFVPLFVLLLFFWGCSHKGYTLDEANRIYVTKTGKVIAVKDITIEAGSQGSVIGGIVGLIIGTQIGKGRGNTAATLGGGLIGSLLGAKVSMPGQQLQIELDDGRIITTVIRVDKSSYFRVGDRVRLVLDGKRIVHIERI